MCTIQPHKNLSKTKQLSSRQQKVLEKGKFCNHIKTDPVLDIVASVEKGF